MDVNCTIYEFPDVISEKQVAAFIFSGIFSVIAVLLTISGYRLIKCSGYCSGFLIGVIVPYVILEHISDLTVPILLCVSASLGFASGFVPLMYKAVAMVLLALTSGEIGACLNLVILLYLWHISSWLMLAIVLVGWPLVVISISVIPTLHKAMMIFNTSFIGGGLVLFSLDVCINSSRIVLHLYSILRDLDTLVVSQPCSTTWALFAAWPLVTVSGIALQSMFTARTTVHNIELCACVCDEKNREIKNMTESVITVSSAADEAGDVEAYDDLFRTLYSRRLATGEVLAQSCLRNGKVMHRGLI